MTVIRKLGRYNKLLVLGGLFGLSWLDHAAGAPVGLDPSEWYQQLVAAVAVWLVPNKEA